MSDLAAVLLAAQSDGGSRHTYGLVTQASPLLVKIGSSTVSVSVHRVASYTPTLSDVVLVLERDADRIVIGKVV